MATATMGPSSVDRLARSKRPTVERAEIHIPPAPVFPLEAVTGDPSRRAQAVASFNNALQKWRNDAWSIEAPFVPDAELQSDVATLEDATAKMSTKLDRAAVDIRRSEADITTLETNVTTIDNSITTINNQITNINTAITGTGIVQANGAAPPSAILGTAGYFPYWSATAPYLKAASTIFTTGTFTGVGLNTGLVAPVTPDAPLHVWVHDFTTSTVVDVLKIYHGIATNLGTLLGIGGGTGFLFAGASDSVINREMGRIQTRWTVAADATRASAMEWQTVSGAATATRMALSGAGGLSVGDASNTMPVGVINAVTGYRIGNAAGNQQYLRGDGTNFVSSGLVITDATGILPMANGGTNKGMVASAGAVAYSDVDSLELTAVGVAGQVLTSQGAGTPTWTTISAVTPAALTEVDDTNVTITLGGSPSVALLAATSITLGWTGQLSLARGGTNASSFTANAVIFCNAAGTALTDDGAAFTYAASGDNQLLIARTLGVTQSDNVGYYALNSSGALAGAANQQWSPSFLWEGQGWGGSSQAVKYRAYVVPVDAATNPTGYWILERNINALGYVELLRADSTGFLRVLKDDIRITQGAYGLHVTNSTAATASSLLQQWSPPVIYEGQGWKTNATAASQRVQFRNYIAPVIGAAAPTAYFITDYDINASGTFTEALRLDTSGFYRLTKDSLGNTTNTGQIGLQLINNSLATVGLNQNSPVVLFRGAGWKTNAVAASQQVQFRIHVVPVTGAAAPTAMLRIDSEIAGAGSFTQPITISSLGSMSVGAQYEPPFGVINAQVGFKIATAATVGHALISDGTNFISQLLTSALTTYAFTAGSVIFAGPGGTSIAQDNANLFWDDTNNRLGIGINTFDTNESLRIRSAAAVTVSQKLVYIDNDATSSTAAINKYGLVVETLGTWNGAGSITRGIYASVNGGTSVATGVDALVQGGATELRGLNGVSEATVAGVVNSIGVVGVSNNTIATPALAIGGFFNAVGGTNNYGIYVSNGTTKLAIGTTTIVPLLFIAGTDLTAPVAGGMEYDGRFELTDVDAVRRHIVQAVNATKVTAGAPYANDGYVEMVINGTTLRFLTTA